MKETLCNKYAVEYTNEMSHMSLNEFVNHMIEQGFELAGLAYNYYKWCGFSDRLAKIKVQQVLEGEQL